MVGVCDSDRCTRELGDDTATSLDDDRHVQPFQWGADDDHDGREVDLDHDTPARDHRHDTAWGRDGTYDDHSPASSVGNDLDAGHDPHGWWFVGEHRCSDHVDDVHDRPGESAGCAGSSDPVRYRVEQG